MITKRTFNLQPFQSDLLDLSRWVAALLVVVEHLRSLMFADYGVQERLRVGGKAFYFLTGFGHSAVMVFFVMSGFLVGGKVLERLVNGEFCWRKYGIDRISRLYLVYLLALLLGGTFDYFGSHYFNQFGIYNETFPGHIAVIQQNFAQNLSGPVLMVNLAMCQTILGPVFGSNGPMWSLANEFWYYLAGPLLFLVIFESKIARRILGIIGLLGIIWFLPASILIYALVWLLGAWFYFINGRKLLPLWVSLPLFIISFSIARLQWVAIPYLPDFLIGISFALVINSATGISQRISGRNWSQTLAGFSYSVYLCHFPFLVFLLSVMFREGLFDFQGQLTPKRVVIFLLILLLAYAWSFLISLATERQTSRVRGWLDRQMPGVSRYQTRSSSGS